MGTSQIYLLIQAYGVYANHTLHQEGCHLSYFAITKAQVLWVTRPLLAV